MTPSVPGAIEPSRQRLSTVGLDLSDRSAGFSSDCELSRGRTLPALVAEAGLIATTSSSEEGQETFWRCEVGSKAGNLSGRCDQEMHSENPGTYSLSLFAFIVGFIAWPLCSQAASSA